MDCSANFLILAFTASSAAAEVVAPLCQLCGTNFLDHVVHGRDEKPASAARRIENELLLGGVEHFNGHAAHIAWREELAAITAQIRADDFLIGPALHVDVALQQRIHLELGNEIGENDRLEIYASDLLKMVG